MLELQANTAYTLKIGPFIDETDGKTAETGLSIAQADVRLSKNGANIAQKNESTSCTHDELGVYGCPIDTTDTNAEGILQLWVHESGALPVFHEYMVLAQAAYISKYTAKDSGYMDVDAKAISGSTGAADNVEANIGNLDAAVSAVITDTEDLQTQVGTAGDGLTAVITEIDANETKIDAVITDTEDLQTQIGTAGDGLTAVITEIDANETKIDAVIADTEDLQTQIGTAGANLSDLGGMSDGMKAEVQSECDDALVANNLDHLCKTVTAGADMTTEVADNTILSRVLASGDTSAFDPTTDSLQDIYDKIGAASPANFTPATGSTITHGTETNAYTDCATDDGTRWQAVDPEDTNPIEVLCKFALGTTHSAVGLNINGYFNRDGGTAIVEIYAYNYTTSTWDKLSAGTVSTEMRDSAVDKDYSFSLSYGHTKTTATVGEVQIKFLSTVAHAVDVLHLDYVAIEGQPTGAIDPNTIASAVWSHNDGHDVSRHITKYTGEVWYVDTGAGNDANEGHTTHEALATIAEAISQGAAGDRIIVKSGSYTEAGTDLNKAGIEIIAEYGTIMTGGGSGTGLVISANNCLVENLWITPGASQIGFDITGNHGRFINCESYSSGATGYRTGTAAGQTRFINCSSRKYTTAGFELQGAAATLVDCQAMTQHGSSTIGFHLSNTAAHRCNLIRCESINNGTNSFLVVSGADENVFIDCVDSDTCGAASDSGTDNAWRNYKDSDIVAADVSASLTTHDGKLDVVDGIVDAILVDTDSTIPNLITTVDTVVDAIKAKTDALPSGVEKGAELANFSFPMVLSSDHETPATGKTLTEEISKDGGNFAACTNNSAEIQSTGIYKITLTTTEMNANIVVLRFTETDCDPTIITIVTT